MKHPKEYTSLVRRLLEGSLEDIVAMESLELPVSLELYRQVLVAFLSGKLSPLAAIHERIIASSEAWSAEFPPLELLANLRKKLLVRALSQEEILALSEAGQELAQGVWKGELTMLVAAAWEYSEHFSEAIQAYREASRSFTKHGVHGKSLRARFNALTLEGHADPERRLIQEYFFLYREARKYKQPIVMASALLNVSREYQKIGAHKMALKFANRSVACSSPDLGGVVYFLAVAHRAHVLFLLDRRLEAQTDFEEASTSAFPAVQAACSLLASLFTSGQAEENSQLHRSWRERLNPGAVKAKLGPNEEKILGFLSEQPRSKFELMDHLFGGVEHFTAENRLKNLLFRLRQKVPGLVILEGELFKLTDKPIRRTKKAG